MRKGLGALELHFLHIQLSLSLAEELTLGPKQCNTQRKRMGNACSGWLNRVSHKYTICSVFSKTMMEPIMKVNNSIIKPTGEVTSTLRKRKNPTVHAPSATQHIRFIRL